VKSELLYVTTKDEEEAKKIARRLVKERVIVCANIVPEITSIYSWKGEMQEEKEALLLCKTFEEKKEKAARIIKEMHSYDTPCIKSIKEEELNEKYWKWMKEVIK